MWSDCLKNFRGAKVWRGARYANPRAVMTIEALTDREGKEANTSLGREEMLSVRTHTPASGCIGIWLQTWTRVSIYVDV